MGAKAEERFKMKIKEITRRSNNLDAEVVVKLNRVIRGTVRYFAAPFTTGLGRVNALDQFIRRRIRCMKYKRLWKTDNQRLLNRYIRRFGFNSCRDVYLSAFLRYQIKFPYLGQSLGDRPVRERRTLGNVGNRPHCDNGKGVPTGTP